MTLENTLAPRKLEFGIHSIADLKQLLQDALPGANIMANHHVQTDSTHSLESQATHCGIASVPSVPMATCISRNFRFHSQNTIQWQIRQPRTNALHRRVSVPEFLTHLIQQLREQHVDLDGTADALHRSPGRPGCSVPCQDHDSCGRFALTAQDRIRAGPAFLAWLAKFDLLQRNCILPALGLLLQR